MSHGWGALSPRGTNETAEEKARAHGAPECHARRVFCVQCDEGLALTFCILQSLALTWESLSLTPFARDTMKKCFNTRLA